MASSTRPRRPASPRRRLKAAPARPAVQKSTPVLEGTSLAEAKPAPVKIGRAKGRPMLTWVGKRPLTQVTAFPAQLVERYEPSPSVKPDPEIWKDWPDKYPRGGLLFHGDNKEVLAHLLANGFRGKVDLIYIDPPFDSGADYVRKVSLRGTAGTAKIEGETYTLGEQVQYTDIWANDNYLQFMYERLLLLKELLRADGSIWVHTDTARGHYLRVMLDEVFGAEAFVNQVVWKRSDAHSDVGQGAKHLGSIHDMLLLYAGGEHTLNEVFLPLSEKTKENWYRNVEPGTGRFYNRADISGPGGAVKGNPVYTWKGLTRAWRFSLKRMEEFERLGRLVYSESGIPYLKRYLDDSKGVPLQDWWDDIQMLRGLNKRGASSYPTEKPPALAERIVSLSSKPGDIVLDCFIGSGTTAAAAQRLGRRWIACDINKGAIQTTAKRMQQVTEGQRQELAKSKVVQAKLLDDGEPENKSSAPTQLAFTVWRVNDYDLQIQHNEAVALACEHIGVQRTKGDSFFDGTLGKKLVKIVPFNHPLTPLDLEAVRAELDARPDEDRQITMVTLGIELASTKRLEDWNRLRKGKTAANRIDVIELRTDPKYGRFMQHHPAQASVSIKRSHGKIRVTIDDFISSSILERLRGQAGVVTPQIKDWRWLVDSVAIDPTYDGQVFNSLVSDIPERRTDLVGGTYEVDAPEGPTTVAVRVTDMLGEEVIVTTSV